MPVIETYFASSGGKKMGRSRRTRWPARAHAVANAIYYATGKRARSTPLKQHDLTWV
jgi:isoquinoline 1-oxidoreductase beta subunit